jgi:steroid delta-isomerase-like uncharacterized protein
MVRKSRFRPWAVRSNGSAEIASSGTRPAPRCGRGVPPNVALIKTSTRRASRSWTSTSRKKTSTIWKASCEHLDQPGILRTFGPTARYDDEPWDGHYIGHDGVRTYYDGLLKAMPDLRIEVQQRYASQNAVIVEVIISGHHLGAWRGLPPTGRPVRFPLCGIFVFDNEDRLAGEKIYYDRATVLRQLGIFLEPDHGLGRIATIITHPITMARTILRMALARRRS